MNQTLSRLPPVARHRPLDEYNWNSNRGTWLVLPFMDLRFVQHDCTIVTGVPSTWRVRLKNDVMHVYTPEVP